MITNFRPEFTTRYATAIQLYEKAHKRLAEGDADDTLTAARKSLEFFAKEFCQACNLPIFDEETGTPKRIEDLINTLTEYAFLTEHESAALHQLRKLGNVGSHGMGSMNEALEAVDLLDKTVMIFAEKDALVSGEQNTATYVYDDANLSQSAQLLSKSPFLYRLFSEFTLIPFLPAFALPYLVVEKTTNVLLLMLAMAAVVGCVVLHGKLVACLNTIPVPEECFCNRYLAIARGASLVVLPVLMICLLFMTSLYPSIFAKIIIFATVALCIYICPTLRLIVQKLRGKKI